MTIKSRIAAPLRWTRRKADGAGKKIKRRLTRKTYDVISLNAFKEKHGVASTTQLTTELHFAVPGPRFVGDYDYDLRVPETIQVHAPGVEAVEFSRVRAMGGTNLLFHVENAIHPDISVPRRDMFSCETNSQGAFIPSTGKLVIYPSGPPKSATEAVSLLGECTGNYAHWLLETLPKLVLVDRIERFNHMPLLVDSWIHPMFFQTLTLLNTHARGIIRVDRWQPIDVQRLVFLTPPSYTAPENREYHTTGKRPEPSPASYPVSAEALDLMRRKAVNIARRYVVSDHPLRTPANIFRIDSGNDILAAVHDPPVAQDPYVQFTKAKRIYLKRAAASAGNPRQLREIHRVESILAGYGFVAIDPASLSFPEQVLLLQNAEIVVGPIGAAMANAIFAPPGLKVIGLSPYFQGADYYYFTNLMGALGHELYYVLGPQVDQPNVHWLHRDYVVDLQALKSALDRFCN